MDTDTLTELTRISQECAHLECDGLVRVLSAALRERGEQHTVFGGRISHRLTGTAIEHLWIELPSGQCLDFRARMWMGERDDVPHGLFDPANYPQVEYQGTPLVLSELPPAVLEVLKTPFPPEAMRNLLGK